MYDPFQTAYEDNVNNGWTKPEYKVQPINDGWEVLELKPMLSGTPQWVRVFYSRDEQAVQRTYNRFVKG